MENRMETIRCALPQAVKQALHRRVGEPRGRRGRAPRVSPPPSFETRTIQPVATGRNN